MRTDIIAGATGRLAELAKTGASVTAAEAVRDLVDRIDELTPATSGRFLHRQGQVLPW